MKITSLLHDENCLYLEWSGKIHFLRLFQSQSNQGDVVSFSVRQNKNICLTICTTTIGVI